MSVRLAPIVLFATLVLAGLAPLPAQAVTARLRAGVDLDIPETNLVDEPSLAGVVIEDRLEPFVIRNEWGLAVCRGTLQLRVVRSTATGRLDFAYRIRNTRGSATISGIHVTDFSGRAIRIGYRSDGLGTKAPTRAYRHPTPGAEVVTGGMELRCAAHEESRFIEIRTDATTYETGGTVTVHSWSGEATEDAPTPHPL